MADPLGASLSEEEAETIVPSSTASGGSGRVSTRKLSSSPTQRRPGYKFTEASTPLTAETFDFASKSKTNGQSNSTSSSAESSDHESFVHLNSDGGEEKKVSKTGRERSCPPLTPSKMPTPPHKRAAELVDGENEKDSVSNGSPPGSPAPQKKKTKFDEYVTKEELKNAQALQERKNLQRALKWKNLGRSVVFALIAVIVGASIREEYIEQPLSWLTKWMDGKIQEPSGIQGNWTHAHIVFRKQLKQLEKKYPSQNRETWIQLTASISSTLTPTKPEHPAAVTLLFPPSVSPKFAYCFTTSIAKAVNFAVAPALNCTSPSGPQYLSPDSFDGSRSVTSLREELDTYFASRGKSVVVHDVDKMTKESDLQFFHGLCDNYKAVHTRATVLFPLQVPPEIYDKYSWTHDRAGDISADFLNTAFSKVLGADSGPALVARIADAVVLLNDGDSC